MQMCTMGAREQSPKGLDGWSYQGGVSIKGLPFTPVPRAPHAMQLALSMVGGSHILCEVRRPWQPLWALNGTRVAQWVWCGGKPHAVLTRRAWAAPTTELTAVAGR